jgi:DNA topoisomerase VI subunit B
MALRAFRANPCLGGFGGESSGRRKVNSHATEKDCDAFAQIVKELVDNAVDACYNSQGKRIRVVIERLEQDDEEDGEYSDADFVLRVTVSDNGRGMEDIQQCVNAFRSSKAGNTSDEEDTAGRYGIGLTLCLLHAQRLVPDSCASITSATLNSLHFTRASYVVDTEGDSVRCVKRELLPKTNPTESGTAVSLLVPVRCLCIFIWLTVFDSYTV